MMCNRRWSAPACAAVGLLCAAACDPLVTTMLVDLGPVVEVPLVVDFAPLSLEPGDFDGNGNVDLLVSGSPAAGGATGVVLRGNGDGTLQAGIGAGFLACSAYPVVGNLDGDARSDIVTLGCGNTVAPFVGRPNGTFSPWWAWPSTPYYIHPITGLALGDFEGDGDGDVFVLRVTDTALSSVALVHIELSNSAHGFWSSGTTSFSPARAGFVPTQMLLAHLDDDRLLDLVLTDRDHTVVTMLGAVPESFGLARELEVSVNPWLTRVGDMNGDGRDDLLVVGRTDGAVQVLLSNGDGSMLPLPPVGTLGLAPYDAALGDLDGDGNLDVALVDDAVPQLVVLQGDGAGGLGGPTQRLLPSGAIRVHAVDLDGDAIDDVVAATFAAGSVSFLPSTLP
jgi:hypothetical protein